MRCIPRDFDFRENLICSGRHTTLLGGMPHAAVCYGWPRMVPGISCGMSCTVTDNVQRAFVDMAFKPGLGKASWLFSLCSR